MGLDDNYGSINDPIHGTIRLTKEEWDIIGTTAFQRLRGLCQLGLAHLVFPGATHTRFSHSLGVLHLTTRFIQSIRRKDKDCISEQQERDIRLLALLHDIGHLPLSHAMESPFQRNLENRSVPKDAHITTEETKPTNSSNGMPLNDMANFKARPGSPDHEAISGRIILENKQIGKAFNDPTDSRRISDLLTKSAFKGEDRTRMLVSGSIDADRLDFVSRDAVFSGVAFGKAEANYLIDSMAFDRELGIPYIQFKGRNALEHFLSARVHQYHVSFHKTVMGLELLAQFAYHCISSNDDVLSSLKSLGIVVPKSDSEIVDQSQETDFLFFDDAFFWRLIHNWEPEDTFQKDIRICLLNRIPPILLYEDETRDINSNTKNPVFDKLSDSSMAALMRDDSFWHFDELEIKIDRSRLAIKNLAYKVEKFSPERLDAAWMDHMKHRKGDSNGIDFEAFLETIEYAPLAYVQHEHEIRPLATIEQSHIAKVSRSPLYLRRLYWVPQPTNLTKQQRIKIRTGFEKRLRDYKYTF